MSKETVQYTHENGYVARLYGNSSMDIFYGGEFVMHLSVENVNTEADVMEILEDIPDIRANIVKITEKAEEEQDVN